MSGKNDKCPSTLLVRIKAVARRMKSLEDYVAINFPSYRGPIMYQVLMFEQLEREIHTLYKRGLLKIRRPLC